MKPVCIVVFMAMCCMAVAPVCVAEELYLVKGDQRATILVSLRASPVEIYAAQELQRTIRLMSGVELNIVQSDKGGSGPLVVIGTPATYTVIAAVDKTIGLAGAGEEQIAIQRKGNILYIAGNTPRAALYATYTFLQDVLGARWLWPGVSGEFIPLRKVIGVGQLSIRESPDLAIRSLAITGVPNGDPETDTWMARNKLNVVSSRSGADPQGDTIKLRKQKGFLVRVAGHNIVLPVETLQAHPEYLAEIGGKRQFHPRGASHLCWSNPALQQEVANMVGSWWDQSPYPDVIHFYPADQTQYCTCSNCKAMGDISTRWQKFSAIIIGLLNKKYPGKKYWTYAYLEYKKVPQTHAAPFDFIAYTLYDGSYRHLLSGDSKYNKLPLEEIDGWLGKQVNLGVRGYEYIIFKVPMFTPMVSWVVDQMRWIHEKHMTGYLSELPAYGMPRTAAPENTYWTCSRMALYAAAKSAWNSRVQPMDLVTDWCNTVYGPAAGEMSDYYRSMEKAWLGSAQKISVFTNAPVSYVDSFITPALFRASYDHFEKALRLASSVTDTVRRNRIVAEIGLEKKMLDNWQRIYDMKHKPTNRFASAGTDRATEQKRIVLFDAGADSGPLSVELQQAGWEVAIEKADEHAVRSLAGDRPAAMLLRYEKDRQGKPLLSDAFFTNEIRNYVEQGGLCIIAANGNIPVDRWFTGTPAVQWIGGQPGTVRRSAQVSPGNWLTQPNDLAAILNKGVTPLSGYKPLSAGWNELATIQTAQGETACYLLAKPLGKGMLVLTSAPMSYGGGFEMLGNRNPLNVVKLIENLRAVRN